MNKKAAGGMAFFGMMLSVMIWIGFTQLLGPVKTGIEDARSPTQLNCTNTENSVGVKATCIAVDWTLFGWTGAVIALIIGAAGGGLIDRQLKKREIEVLLLNKEKNGGCAEI